MKTRSRQTHNLQIAPSRWLAYAGAGAATVALIVLGGIAITGAAGAASAAGRRGLINGSVGGSL